MTLASRIDLGFKPQKELSYTKLLPFVDQLEEESLVWLVKIKENLGRAIMLREIEPSCVFWTKQLYMYIEVYGLKFSKEDHVTFVKLMYELFTIPKLNPSVIIICGNVLQILLKKRELISPDELELPWRPLYEMLLLVRRPGLHRFSMQMRTSTCNVAHAVNTYFPLSATQEMLDELRPKLCPFDALVMGRSIDILETLLPTKLRPQHHSVGYCLWFDEFMNLWSVCQSAPYWENTIQCLMGRLAIHNIGYIDWNPHLPLMFSRFIRWLNLPVTYKRIPNNTRYSYSIAHICMWIVATLGNGSDAQMYLDKFLKTIETYLYPANSGRWTGRLSVFLTKLTYHFVIRLRKERYSKKPSWETPVPDNYKLTDDDIDAFVKSVLPLAMILVYHKQNALDRCSSLRNLALMRPNLVIPDVLERMYSTFDSLTEPHKLTALMGCMSLLARPMVQGSRYMNGDHAFAEGPTHVLQLLFLSLPGIDANDLKKCYLTLNLIGTYCGLISIIDCSRSTADMTEVDRLACETTARFEDFVLQFLDRVFLLIEASPLVNDISNTILSNLDRIARSLLQNTCAVLLLDTSKPIFDSALHKLRTFMTERYFESDVAGQLASAVCKGFTMCNGRDTLRALLPMLAETILSLVNEVEDISKEYNLDHRLLHNLRLLIAVVETTGDNLLPYMDTLFEILDRVIHLKSNEGHIYVNTVLYEILNHLSNITMYPPRKIMCDDPDYFHVGDWGKGVSVDKLQNSGVPHDAKYYIPGEAELDAIRRAFSRYLPPQIDKLKKYCEDPSTLTPEELRMTLNIVDQFVEGPASVLPLWSETPLVIVETSVENNISVPLKLGNIGCVTMPDGSNVRQYLAGIMSQVQRTMLNNGEDDTKSFKTLINIWKSLLLGNVHQQEFLASRLDDFRANKRMYENKLEGNKNRVIRLIYNRCSLQLRIREMAHNKNSFKTLTETHKRIMLELFTLATSRYGVVRSGAQIGLFSAFRYLPYSYKFLVPHICDILSKDTEEHHNAFKGILYILIGEDFNNCGYTILTKEDWNLIKTLWPAIILAKPSEKPSINFLKEKVAQLISNFVTYTIELEVPDKCLTVARDLWKHPPMLPQLDENMVQSGVENLKKFNESNVAAYTGLLDELLRCILEKSLHWRDKLIAMGFIRDIVHPDQSYPAQVVRYFLQALIHESIEERKIATKVVGFMLKQQKREHPKVKVDIPSLSKENTLNEEEQPQTVTPGIRADNIWLQYNYKTRPLTAEQWDEPRYVHQLSVGYYAWPKVLKVYAPSSQQPDLDPATRELTDCEKEVHLFFDNPQNVEKLINYFSLEDKKGKDRFDWTRSLLFKGLFGNHGTVHLKHFLPHLQRLVADKYESSQRCAAEIIAGLIKGSKHWPFQMTCDMWQEMLPVIRTAIANITDETCLDWNACFRTAQEHRDPNRSHWLLECLMEEPPPGETSFVQTERLYVLQNVLIQAPWRETELLHRLLTRIEDRLLTNPLQNVRECLGSLLATIFIADLKISHNSFDSVTPRVRTLLNKIMPQLNQLITKNTDETESIPEKADLTLDESESITKNVVDLTLDESKVSKKDEAPKRLLKTVCKWIRCSLLQVLYCAVPEFYQIFPVICQLGTSENDKELHDSCLETLAALARAIILPEDMPTVMATVKTTSEHPSWSVRFDCLEYLQVLVFHNMSIILSDSTWTDCVKDIVLRLLEDDRLEVRKKAGQVLSGLLHCTFIADYEKLLEEFRRKARTRLRKKNNPTDEDSSRSVASNAIRLRHAGVLGLCAFIDAHPYDVPKYVPPIFEDLGHHMNDPQPIPTTIKNCLNDFKRTHYENWTGINGHAQQFTDEQLDVLQNLTVPPAHYA